MPELHLAAHTRPQIRRDRLLKLPDVEAVAGIRKSTIYALMAKGKFPKSVQVTARCVVWPESRVLQWVQDQIAMADALALAERVVSGIGEAG